MRFTHFIGLLCFILLACTDRDRVNPLDPKNPDTLGEPVGFNVISIQDTVFLSWDSIKLNDLIGYQIYRREGDQNNFDRYAWISPQQSAFADVDIRYNTWYSYRITALGNSYESDPSESLRVLPGPTFNWAVDNLTRQLVKLTHDAQHQIFRTSGFYTLIDLEPNPRTGEVWVLEQENALRGNALRISPGGDFLDPIIQFRTPVDITIDVASNSIWVADREAGAVSKFDSSGDRILTIADFDEPVSVDVDQRNGACWVADRKSQKVARISANGTNVIISPLEFVSIQSLAVNSGDGSVWVVDSTRVLKLADDGNLALTVSHAFARAFKAAINECSGDVWVIDLGPSAVIKFSETGATIFQVGGFSQPQDLAVNLFDSSCLIADTGNNRLVRIDADGNMGDEFTSIGRPEAVGVEYLRQP